MRASVVEHLAHDQLTRDEPMDEVSQNGRQRQRPWTAKERTTIEVAAACGVSYRTIEQTFGCSRYWLLTRLNPAFAEKSREYHRVRYESNQEQCRAQSKKWQQANRERKSENYRKWKKSNPEKVKEYNRRHREANPEKARKRASEWAKNNPEKNRDKNRRRDSFRRASRRNALCPATSSTIEARFSLWRNRCAFCGVDAKHPRNSGRDRLNVEHVLALTKNGLDEAENIMPACNTCNSSKNNALIKTWYFKQPFFTEARWRKIQRHCPAAVVGQLPLAFAA